MDGPEAVPGTAEARSAEVKAARRRWITLGEILAVLAVLISALTLWLNWSERSSTAAEKAAESSWATSRAAKLTLNGEAMGKGDRLDVRPASSDQLVQEQLISFPSALGIDPVQITGAARLEAAWFADALKRARHSAGLPNDSRGDERLPIVIRTRFLVDGEAHQDEALYDVGYTVKGQMFGSHAVILRGLSLVARVNGKGAAATLDCRWRSLMPATAKPSKGK